MDVELSDPTLADDLVAFLSRAACETKRNGGGMLEVRMSSSLPEEAARLELETHLERWRALHPGVRVRRRPAYDL
jgi:hypothetical protein